MFSGIIETVEKVLSVEKSVESQKLKVSYPKKWDDLKRGQSFSVNGVCLTLINFDEAFLEFEVVPHTLQITTLKNIQEKMFVNLERSLKFGERVGGHYVQGHVHEVGEILDVKQDEQGKQIYISASKTLMQRLHHKDFVAVDGMSLTLISPQANFFRVALIPFTEKNTLAKFYQAGTFVNIEPRSVECEI